MALAERENHTGRIAALRIRSFYAFNKWTIEETVSQSESSSSRKVTFHTTLSQRALRAKSRNRTKAAGARLKTHRNRSIHAPATAARRDSQSGNKGSEELIIPAFETTTPDQQVSSIV